MSDFFQNLPFIFTNEYLRCNSIAMHNKAFSPQLQKKIDSCLDLSRPIKLGEISFASPFLLAPMAGICTPPFRLLMEDLGAGGTVSELISCHGINYENKCIITNKK